MRPAPVGIVCALAAEARHLQPVGQKRDAIVAVGEHALLAVSGIGAAAAARCASALIEAGASALASFGMAGGLDPALAAGAMFLPTTILGPSAQALSVSLPWQARLGEALNAHRPRMHGALLSLEHAVETVPQKAALFARTGAAAVDMESHAVAQAASERALAFIAVRVIVDAAGDSLPRAVTAAADEGGHLNLWRLVAALARSPADLAPLLRLARRYRSASRSLALIARSGALAPAAPS